MMTHTIRVDTTNEPSEHLADPTPRPAVHVYEIRVRGRLDQDVWGRCFDGMTVTASQGNETILRGPVVDQAALYGLLARLRDLALPLVSVNRVGTPPRRPKPDSSGAAP